MFQTAGQTKDYITKLTPKTKRIGVPVDGVRIVIEYENGDNDTCYRSNPAYAAQLLDRNDPQNIEM